MKKNIKLKTVINKAMKDAEFSEHYQHELLINEIANMVYRLRNKLKMTQKELAEKSKTTQPVIARLEGGNDTRIPSLNLLSRIAKATGGRLNVSIK